MWVVLINLRKESTVVVGRFAMAGKDGPGRCKIGGYGCSGGTTWQGVHTFRASVRPAPMSSSAGVCCARIPAGMQARNNPALIARTRPVMLRPPLTDRT
jgi:hypothetical protein